MQFFKEFSMSTSSVYRPPNRILSLTSICVLLLSISLTWTSHQQAGRGSLKTLVDHSSANPFVPNKSPVTPASTILVNSTTDVVNGTDGLCTLREAITAANSDVASGATAGECAAGSSSGSDTIDLAGISGTINLASALPTISSDMSISGSAGSLLTITRTSASIFRILTVASGTVRFSNLALTNGNNNAGGGILNTGTLTITNCEVKGNLATTGGGPAFGGGIDNRATMTIVGSLISDNTSTIGAGIRNSSNLIMINSTVSGNHFTGISNESGLNLVNCTITANDGTGVADTFPAHVRNTIIAGNNGSDVVDHFVSDGNNLIGKSDGTNNFTNGVNGDQVGTPGTPLDPQLAALAGNGGPTRTHALLTGSPAIDAGNDCVTQAAHCSDPSIPQLTADQRGLSRPVDGDFNGSVITDIGAFESQFAVINTNDSGAGSLRQAVIDANAAAGTATIGFGIPSSDPGCSGGSCTITLTTGELILSNDMNITGPGASLLTVSGNNASRAFNIQSGKTVSISNLTIANGRATVSPGGAGILNNGTLALTNCNFYGNTSTLTGGAITNNGTSLTLTDCNVGGTGAGQPNSGTSGAGIYNNTGTLAVIGGSIVGNTGGPAATTNNGTVTYANVSFTNNNGNTSGALLTNDGTTTLVGCLIANNIGPAGGGIGAFGLGSLVVKNSTLSGNGSPDSGAKGGGLFVNFNANVTLANVTITNNNDPLGDGGGIYINSPSTTILRNTIVAGNHANTTTDINGNVSSSSSFNLIGTGGSGGLTNGVNNNQVGVANPGLGPLANNGGPTQTHALLASSPALDAGDNCVFTNTCSPALPPALINDQRGAGFSRWVDGSDADTTPTVDIGAFEAQVSVEDVPDKLVSEDGELTFTFRVAGNIASATASSSNTALVANAPASLFLSGSGSTRGLDINPLANQNGTTTITLTVTDSNGQSMMDTFLLTVFAINDAPTFTKGANQIINEDAAAQTVTNWATNMSAGPPDESGQTLTFQVIGNDNPALFSVAPAISSSGTLTYMPAANANGFAMVTVNLKDNGGTSLGGSDTSFQQSFTITVNPVNDAPSFTKGADQTVNEDAGGQTVNAWATAISAGPSDESAQTLTFQVTNNTNAALFLTAPAISSTGRLTFTPAANANGTATITINLKDSGGSPNGGADTSASQTFVITVNAVNDQPSFAKGANQSVNEDAGPQTVASWATAMSAGPADESSQSLSFTITNNNPGFFSVDPAVSPNGTLTYTPAANVNGTANIGVAIKDDGGTANGGVDTSAFQTLRITVNAVNDAPSFTKGANQTVNNNAGAQSVPNWATNISVGPSNETGQILTFLVTPDNPSIFSSGPAISSTGTLTYTPSTSGGGTATITVIAQDNGGTANSGVDVSPPQTFTISVTPVGGFVSFASSTGNTAENSGSTTVNVVRSGNTSLAATVNYSTNADAGVPCSTANGVASPKCDFTAALGTLNFAAGETSKTITILLSQDSFVEGPETITLTLSNPTGNAALGTPSSMSVTIADDATEPPGNIIDDANMFVRMHYHDFLNREGDQSGINFWTGQMTNCGSSDLLVCRVNVSGAFFLSIEFQQTGYLVERMYRTAYGQATATSNLGGSHQVLVPIVRANEFLTDTQRIGRGVIVLQPGWETVLENNKQAYALEFVQTTRFITALPTSRTPTQFVDQLNQNAGMVLSPSERTTAINAFGIAADTTSVNARAQVLRQIAEDQDLYNAEFSRAFVLAEYIGYLRRNPNDAPEPTLDYTGYEFWLSKMAESGGDYVKAEMVKAFIASSEYRQRFGP
jgi:CSLREA domain-containing protein